jgi:hypothetical protein
LGVFERKLERIGPDQVGGALEERFEHDHGWAALKQMIEEDRKCWEMLGQRMSDPKRIRFKQALNKMFPDPASNFWQSCSNQSNNRGSHRLTLTPCAEKVEIEGEIWMRLDAVTSRDQREANLNWNLLRQQGWVFRLIFSCF